MCGIAGIYLNSVKKRTLTSKQIEDMIDGLLVGIEERGRHASGVAAMRTNGTVDLEKADIEASHFIQWRRPVVRNKTRSILLHTRFATQGTPQNLDNNHPIPYENSVVIHNGHISNDRELFLTEQMARIAEVDSEAIAALFHKYGLDKAQIPLQKLDGNFAVAAVDKRRPNDLVLAKGYSSPLVYLEEDGFVVWASTQKAIEVAYKYALGKDLNNAQIKNLSLGDILYFENGTMKKYEFEPLEKYNYGYSSWDKKSGWSYTPAKRDDSVSKAVKNSFRSRSVGTVNYVTCVDCRILVRKEEAVTLGTSGWLCDDCYLGTDRVYNHMNHGDAIDRALQEEHDVVLELVAEKFGVTPDFVDWLIFESGVPDGVIKGGKMLSQYNDFSEAYDEFYIELMTEDAELVEDIDDDEACSIDDFSFINRKIVGMLEA